MTTIDLARGSALLVILGAGASFDVIPARDAPTGWEDSVPPLTKDLAKPTPPARNVATKYPRSTPVLSELRERIVAATLADPEALDAVSLEDALADYRSRLSDQNVPNHIMAMRFYLRDLLWNATEYVMRETGGVTNYTALVGHCYRWAAERDTHVCFVSFNYDPLLEYACYRHFGLGPSFLSYVEHPVASVVKPHGSVLWNWVHPGAIPPSTRPGDFAEQSINLGEPEEIPADWAIQASVVTEDSAEYMYGSTRLTLPAIPALALPITKKASLVWPPVHRNFLTERLAPGAFGRVLTIGWRAAEDHFLDLLHRLVPPESRSRLMVVAGGDQFLAEADAEITQERLLNHFGRRISTESSIGGFSSIFTDGTLNRFLRN